MQRNYMLLYILYIENNLDQMVILFKKAATTENKFGAFLKIAFMHTEAVFHKEWRDFFFFFFALPFMLIE